MYSRTLGDRELTIGVSGMLKKNALIMYDRETETLWEHFTGEAIAGPLKGSKLQMLRSMPRIKFADWKKAYPDTKVLSVEGSTYRPSVYAGYFRNPDRLGVRPVTNSDDRLPGKSLVLGVTLEKDALAVPLETFVEKPVVTATLGGRQIAVYVDVSDGVYGAVLLPEGVTIKELKDRRLVASDGRTWSAIDGRGEGSALDTLPAIRSFWFGWVDYHPKTAVVKG